MNRRNDNSESAPDKGRMRIVFVELEGNNQSLQEGLRTLVATMNRPSQATFVQKRIVNDPVPQAGDPAPIQDSLFADGNNTPDLPEETSGPDETTAAPTAGRKRGEGKKDRNTGLAQVADLNLRPAGKPSLKEFVNGKRPDTDEEYVLVFVYYLKQTVEVERVGPNHVFHCFKDVSVRVPADLKQTIRNTAKKVWLSFTELEDLRVAVEGQNIVEHDLPRQAKAAGSGT